MQAPPRCHPRHPFRHHPHHPAVAALAVLLAACGPAPEDMGMGEIVGQAPRPAPLVREEAQRNRHILFGDLHTHTTFSPDGFMLGMPLTGGEGARPPADACDYARFCSALDFWGISDHAEGITPRRWQETKRAIRQCNAVSQPAGGGAPDMASFLGWEWSQVALTPEQHFGHKNVFFLDTDDDAVPARPIAAPRRLLNRAPLSRPAQYALAAADWRNRDYYLGIGTYYDEIAATPLCPRGVDSRQLPADCLEVARTPAELFRKLDEWGFDALVIPHGNSWGLSTPALTRWDKQLTDAHNNPAYQRLVEIYSGHGNTEEYRDYAPIGYAPINDASTNGTSTNNAPTNDASPNNASPNNAPTNGTSTNGTSTNGTSTNGTSTKNASTNGTSTNGTSTKNASTNGTSTNNAPTNDAAAPGANALGEGGGGTGQPYCPQPSAGFLPCCWRAGELIQARCDDPRSAACLARVREARRLYLDAGISGHLTVPGAEVEDWLDCGQCRDCFNPPFKHRPGASVQYALSLNHPDNAPGNRTFRWGFIGSSDNHRARPGNGFKDSGRRRGNTEVMGAAATRRFGGVDRGDSADLRARSVASLGPIGLNELRNQERQQSFFLTGGLVAVHSTGRQREAIWEALKARRVYATSGERILLWFDLVNGADGPLPMGSSAALAHAPRFRVEALGAYEQLPGCPGHVELALGAARQASLCADECHNPGSARRRIERIEVVRIRPRQHPGETPGELIEDPWRSFPCPGGGDGCTVEFEDKEFPRQRRQMLYYARAIQQPTPAVNAGGLRCEYDGRGRCVAVNPCHGDARTDPADDCLSPNRERAWSSPIYIDFKNTGHKGG